MKIVLLLGFIVGLSAPSQLQAQTPAGREPDIHLDLSTSRLISAFRDVPFVFQDTGVDCPEERWTITILNGTLKTSHFNLPPFEQATFPTHMKNDPADDFTWRLQYIRPNCRVDIDIREQVRSDSEWKSLLVTKERRPSLSEQERQEAVRRRLGDLGLLKESKPAIQLKPGKKLVFGSKCPPRWSGSTFSWGVEFDDAHDRAWTRLANLSWQSIELRWPCLARYQAN